MRTIQGAFVNGARPRTKKLLRDALQQMPQNVELERTSTISNDEYGGLATELPLNKEVYVVGPDPYKQRNWYANVKRTPRGFIVR